MHRRTTFATACSLAMLLLNASALAAETDRGRNWEATLQIIGSGSESSGGEEGSSIRFDSTVGWAFGITYNISEHLSLGFDGSFLRPDYKAVIVPEDDDAFTIRHRASIFNGALNGTWNIMKGNFTPYLQLGIGWTNVDSNVADGPPSTGCWWDPWWGYICSDFYSTYKDNRFSWNAGAGLRYEFQNSMFVKGSINRVYLDGGNNAADPTFDMWKLELGWMFR